MGLWKKLSPGRRGRLDVASGRGGPGALGMRIKELFFSTDAVKRAVDGATRKVLSRFGAFVMTTARQSIKKAPYAVRKKPGRERTDFGKKISKPGKPPFSQTGLLKKFIYFSYDASSRSVVVGPERIGGKGEAPELLEYGGWARRPVGRRRKGRTGRSMATVEYKARPFMGPALERDEPKLPDMWRDSVRMK
ncbi:MAG TPA: hypothetical protein VFH53_06055 [Phycisphaerae bacterium]|nr:hypothetical protein [Phycisphaerae bacterium]HUW99911.1 hypothetical protein [Phycisphaerae bacterium]